MVLNSRGALVEVETVGKVICGVGIGVTQQVHEEPLFDEIEDAAEIMIDIA
jgi:hypothetical protein